MMSREPEDIIREAVSILVNVRTAMDDGALSELDHKVLLIPGVRRLVTRLPHADLIERGAMTDGDLACRGCEKNIRDDAIFCWNCGEPVNTANPVIEEAEPEPRRGWFVRLLGCG